MLKLCFNFQRFSHFCPFSITKMVPKIKIGTHNGNFHCDEVLACAMLKCAKHEYSDAEIVRSRDMNILNECDIVVDVGGVFEPKCHRYDHHQKTFNHSMNSLNPEYPWTIKLSSAGLVFYHFGHQIISRLMDLPVESEETKMLFNKMYENFVQEIDALDNGIEMYDGEPRYQIHSSLSSRVAHCRPSWNDENADENMCFKKASELVEKEFLGRLYFYAKVWLPARDIVKKTVLNRESVHSSGMIIEFEEGGVPWKEHLFELEKILNIETLIKYAIYRDNNGNWRVQCVPISSFTFENRLSLPEKWRGLRDEELSQTSGIPDCTFVHMSGFIGGNKTREGALKMAEESLKSVK